MRLVVALSLLLALLLPATVQAQAASAPPFVVGPNKSYCHVTDATNTVWMNTLLDDGDGVPYEIFGAPTTTIPGANLGVDPVAQSAFEVRIPLMPALEQSLVLDGDINVQAYIGGGSATAGSGSIGTKLVVAGAEVASAANKDHQMSPAQTTYNPISWTMPAAGISIPAGSSVEWIISGTATGNNVFLACHEARGRSYIELPVASAGGGSNATVYHGLTGTAPKLIISAVNGTDAVHVYNWTGPATPLVLNLTGDRVSGNATIKVVDAANKTLANVTFAENRTLPINGTAGNWTITVTLDNFTGNMTAVLAPPPAQTSESGSKSATRTASASRSGTGNATAKPKVWADQEDTPGVPAVLAIGVLAAAVALRRRR